MITVYSGEQDNVIQGRGSIVFSAHNFSYTLLQEAIQTPSLFGEPKTIVLLYVLNDEVLRLLSLADDSVSIIIKEQTLSSASKKQLGALGAEIIEAVKPASATLPVFDIAQAFLARDKKKAWLVLQDLQAKGVRPEELAGIVWWQVKTVCLVATEKEPKGVSAFPKQQARKMLSKRDQKDFFTISSALVDAIHRPKLGFGSADTALEEYILRYT